MLSFKDWQRIQAMTLAGPSGATSAFDNLPMGERGYSYQNGVSVERSNSYRGTPDSIFAGLTQDSNGIRQREIHNDTENGEVWQFDTVYAVQPKRNTWS
jgi:hypothetical protein